MYMNIELVFVVVLVVVFAVVAPVVVVMAVVVFVVVVVVVLVLVLLFLLFCSPSYSCPQLFLRRNTSTKSFKYPDHQNLAKLSYFTILDFPEIGNCRGFPFLKNIFSG